MIFLLDFFKIKNSTFYNSNLYELFNKIYSINNSYYYVRTLCFKKISLFLKNEHGIIVNYKKIYSIRKEIGFRTYFNHFKHPNKRPNNHRVIRPNQFFKADIKFMSANNKYIFLLEIINVF